MTVHPLPPTVQTLGFSASLPDLVRMKLTRKAINYSVIRLDFPDRILNDKKTGNWGVTAISLTKWSEIKHWRGFRSTLSAFHEC